MQTKLNSVFLLICLLPSLGKAQESGVSKVVRPRTVIKLASEIQWQKLNPARGDASPQAGTIWGDQTKGGESGFLVKFVDGFSSPPHIHNITYRGIVLGGGLHNDDPDAKQMWMKAGSYWTQPAGEVHITAARGVSIGYVEIQSGPYLVKPTTEAFDNGERPVNVDSTNIVWLDATNTTWIKSDARTDVNSRAKQAFLWGDPNGNQVIGTMLKLPAGFSGRLMVQAETLRAIVIQGEITLQEESGEAQTRLNPGSYFQSEGEAEYRLSCEKECTIYVRTKRRYLLVPDQN